MGSLSRTKLLPRWSKLTLWSWPMIGKKKLTKSRLHCMVSRSLTFRKSCRASINRSLNWQWCLIKRMSQRWGLLRWLVSSTSPPMCPSEVKTTRDKPCSPWCASFSNRSGTRYLGSLSGTLHWTRSLPTSRTRSRAICWALCPSSRGWKLSGISAPRRRARRSRTALCRSRGRTLQATSSAASHRQWWPRATWRRCPRTRGTWTSCSFRSNNSKKCFNSES